MTNPLFHRLKSACFCGFLRHNPPDPVGQVHNPEATPLMTTPNEKRRRLTGRQTGHTFFQLPHNVLSHPNFATLSPRATKLVIDLGLQFRGKNNGDLAAPLSQMKKRGWNSSDQLNKAKRELIDKGIILVARQGGLNKPTLFALTWLPVDDCNGKLDIRSTTMPLNIWRAMPDSDDGPVQF